MMPPPHILPLLRLRGVGIDLRQALQCQAVPRFKRHKRALLVVGDDPDPTQGHSRGPDAFDGAALRGWFAGMPRGAPIGVFAGAPVASAYATVCDLARTMDGHGIIVECDADTWPAWAAYATRHAPEAMRLDAFPPSMRGAALAAIRAAGGAPVEAR